MNLLQSLLHFNLYKLEFFFKNAKILEMVRQYKKIRSVHDFKHERARETERKRGYRKRIASVIPTVITRPSVGTVLKKRAAEWQRRYYAKPEKRFLLAFNFFYFLLRFLRYLLFPFLTYVFN